MKIYSANIFGISISELKKLTKNWTKFNVNVHNSKETFKEASYKISYSDFEKCRVIRTKYPKVDQVEIVPKRDIYLYRFIHKINLI